ncbi:unnamed protein product [Rotaria socialis]|uniref:Uncharacterized protein n=1 Tax=Rotaria socialis TaxID=392032 RepID=A0A820MD97_9BILA|nr:unnamed protein product [Rotaria socialis]
MANNLPRDITAAQNEIGRLQNQLNHVQISLAASRFSRTTDRQEYNRRINELKQKLEQQDEKLEQQDEKLEQQQEMINNLISVNLCTISLFSLVVIFEATYVKLRSTHDDAQPVTFNGTKPGIPTDNEQLTR